MDAFLRDIKFNCDVSDARYWGYFSICGLLMRYRDLFRSEEGLEPWDPVRREEISAWIERKESGWTGLEGQEFRELVVRGTAYSPFDTAGINQAIAQEGYVYGAGYGMYLKPTFFLARALSDTEQDGHRVRVTGRELARDLFTAPAMLQERSIFLRLEPLKALLWDKYTELGPGCSPALADAFEAYGLGPGRPVNDALARDLDRVVTAYSEILLHHELAESIEAVPHWKELLARAGDRKVEHYLRAVNDLVADTSERGPLRRIVRTRDRGALGLSIGLMDGYRRLLSPEIREAYKRFLHDGNWETVEDARMRGYARFVALRERVIGLSRQSDQESFNSRLRTMMRIAEQAGPSAPSPALPGSEE
ncbi:MAG: Sfum_1244 family protein [Nitrospirota bacterium]